MKITSTKYGPEDYGFCIQIQGLDMLGFGNTKPAPFLFRNITNFVIYKMKQKYGIDETKNTLKWWVNDKVDIRGK